MKLTSYYLHAFSNQEGKPYDIDKTLQSLSEILESKAILSRRGKGDLDTSKGGWNGTDYISICDYRRKDARPYQNVKYYKGYTAYETYIKQSPAFILKKNKIDAIKPTLMPPIIFDWDSHYVMNYLGNRPDEDRYSDLPDELQVKGRIPLDRAIGLTIPVDYMASPHEENDSNNIKIVSLEELYNYVQTLKGMLDSSNVESKIYDLASQTELNENTIEEVYTRVRRKNY